jgi:hypothetical protein
MAIIISFKKDVSVDLNAYYPSFPKKLREAIDEELYKLLGGGTAKQPRIDLSSAMTFLRTDKPFVRFNSKQARACNAVGKGEKFTREMFYVAAQKNGIAAEDCASSLVAAVRSGYFKMITI